MKHNWHTKTLGEVCEIVNGGTPDTKVAKYWNGKYLWITPKDMGRLNNIYVDDTERKLSAAGLKDSSAKMLPKNSVILSSRAPIGHLAINRKAMSTNQGCKGLVPRKGLLTLYLYYFLKDSVELLDSLGIGTTFKELSGSRLANIQIPLPPLPNQRRIVKKLGKIFTGIDIAKRNTEKNLQNACELFESSLQRIFANQGDGWEEKTLGEVCDIRSKLIDPRKPKFLNLKHVGAGNIEAKSGKLINLQTSREEKLISGKFQFDGSTVLYSKIRPYLMKVVRPDFRGICSADIYPLSPFKSLLIRDYLYYLLLSPEFTEYAIKGSARAGMPKVNRNHLFVFRLFLPPIPKQRSFVAKLDSLSTKTKKLEAIYKQKLNDLDELKKSVLKKAFAGEL